MAVDGHLNFDTGIDKSGFEKALESLISELKNLSATIQQAANIKLTADTSQAQQAVKEVERSIEEVPDKAVAVTTDVKPVEAAADKINDDISDIGDTAEDTADKVTDSVTKASKTAENKVDISADHIENSLKNLHSGFKSLLAAAGVAFGIGAAVKFGKEAVENAASVNAANSQLSQTFSELEDNAVDAMERVADASGIVKTRLQGVGTSVYAFARTSGMDSVQALTMMEEALQVAADSAAYYDRSLEDTSETLMSFLKGNYANDAALGLSATETTRNAAANKLYGKSFQELSEAQKQLTLLQMVKDANALSGAEGQAAREAEGWENVIGNLKEAWRQLLAVVGQPILKLAVSWVQELTQALTYLTEKAQIAFNTLAAVFGHEIEDTAQTTDNIAQSVTAQNDLTDAVEETAKAEAKSLAGFDKLNVIASDKAESAGKTSTSGSLPTTITPDIKVRDNTPQVSKRLERFIKNAQKGFGNLEKYLRKNFGPSFKKVWDELSPQVERFGDNMGQVFGDIKSLGPPLTNYFKGPFTDFMRTFVETSGHILAGLFDSFNTVFSDIWNEAAFPILQNFITTGLPLITQFAEQAVITFGTFFDEVKKSFDLLWKDAAVPALRGIATVWTDTMKILRQFWDKWGEPVFDAFREAIRNTGEIFRHVWTVVFKPVVDAIGEALDDLWTNHGAPLLSNFLDFAGHLAKVALDIYNNFIAPLVHWFVDTFGPAISNVLSNIAESFIHHIGDIMDVFNDLFTLLNDVLTFLEDVFKGDWEAAWNDIKTIFEDVWDLFVDIVKVPLNAVIGLINGFLQGTADAFNLLIGALNKISFETPDWLPGDLGGKKFGIDLSTIDTSKIKITPLAQGTVVPANYGNFLAMLGDNKREPEVVSPLSTIEQAVRNAMSGSSRDQTIHVHVELDGREIGRVAVKAVRDEEKRKGA